MKAEQFITGISVALAAGLFILLLIGYIIYESAGRISADTSASLFIIGSIVGYVLWIIHNWNTLKNTEE